MAILNTIDLCTCPVQTESRRGTGFLASVVGWCENHHTNVEVCSYYTFQVMNILKWKFRKCAIWSLFSYPVIYATYVCRYSQSVVCMLSSQEATYSGDPSGQTSSRTWDKSRRGKYVMYSEYLYLLSIQLVHDALLAWITLVLHHHMYSGYFTYPMTPQNLQTTSLHAHQSDWC